MRLTDSTIRNGTSATSFDGVSRSDLCEEALVVKLGQLCLSGHHRPLILSDDRRPEIGVGRFGVGDPAFELRDRAELASLEVLTEGHLGRRDRLFRVDLVAGDRKLAARQLGVERRRGRVPRRIGDRGHIEEGLAVNPNSWHAGLENKDLEEWGAITTSWKVPLRTCTCSR